MRVATTGSHGLIGSALSARLREAGNDVVPVVRAGDGVHWDPEAGTIDGSALEGVDAVVHLAGEGVGERRWTPAQKAKIRDSRVKGTTTLAVALAALAAKPSVLVSGSAVGFYGTRADELLTETSSPGTGFLAAVVRDWEAATAPAADAGIRVAHIRSGIVLSRNGGALKRQLPLFKAGVGGRLGNGRQWMSWISIDDEVAAIMHVIATPSLSGPLNVTAPNPVTNAAFTRALGRVLRRPTLLAVPRFALNLVLGGELASELLGSQRVIPERLAASGYAFAHPTIDEALRAVV